MHDARTAKAIELMTRFADRTGLSAGVYVAEPRRYLWTDAFALCNFLGLERATGDVRYATLARRLVDRVHLALGRHRADDLRRGWISGLPHAEALAHPTCGGLRIGKRLPERAPADPLDPDFEVDRDGQYFHHLARWMHALDVMTRSTGQATFNVWARELCVAAHHGFTYGPAGQRRLAWKASIDLLRALVPSMGQHDPLDGLVACIQLQATARALEIDSGPRLTAEAADFAEMLDRDALATSEPLGLGGLLVAASRLVQLPHTDQELIHALLAASVFGLRQYVARSDPGAPADSRIGFRELGLAIGLAAVPQLEGAEPDRLGARGRVELAEVVRYAPLGQEIEAFWRLPQNRRTPGWLEDADINDVMLATSLAPEGFLVMAPAAAARPRRARAAPTSAGA